MTRITLYSKDSCSLCEIAKGIIERLSREYKFEFESVDIVENEDLYESYKNDVPVISVNGREIFRGRISEQLLKSILENDNKE